MKGHDRQIISVCCKNNCGIVSTLFGENPDHEMIDNIICVLPYSEI
jgi:hypothetical protein